MQLHGPSVGGWIGILYGTLVVGSALLGALVRSATPIGFSMAYLLGFLVSATLWYVAVHVHLPRHDDDGD